MAVYEDVDAADLAEQVDGAVGRALVVDAQVAQADDVVAARVGEGLDLGLGAGVELALREEGDALYLGGVGLGGRLRGGEAEHAELGAVGELDYLVGVESGGAVELDVGGDDAELGLGEDGLQVVHAVVELVVAESDQVVAGEVHELDGGGALGHADAGGALDEVAGVDEQHFRALGLIIGLERRDLGIAVYGAVHVVGVQDDYLAGQLACGLIRRLCRRGLFRQHAHAQ